MFSFFRRGNGGYKYNYNYNYDNKNKVQFPKAVVSQKYISSLVLYDKKVDSSIFINDIGKNKYFNPSIYSGISKFNQDCKFLAVTCGMLFMLFCIYRRH
jgi:hypothetical protein